MSEVSKHTNVNRSVSMGWSWGGSSATLAALHQELLDPARNKGATVIAQASKAYGRHLWVVWEHTDKSRVLVLYLCDRAKVKGTDDTWETGYKVMDEDMGPYELDCPLRFFDLVKDPGGHATAWRQRCRDALKLKSQTFTPGDRVTCGGDKVYRVISRYKRSWLIEDEHGRRWKGAPARMRKVAAPVPEPETLEATQGVG